MIKVKDLTFQYSSGLTVLNRLNFEINRGEFVALIGQNGAGKTTLLKQFNGLLMPTSGKITVAGMDTRTTTTSKLARQVGYLFQNPDHQIFMPTVAKEIGFGPVNLGLAQEAITKQVAEAACQVGLSDVLTENPLFLSKGQRQRVAFASLLSMRPEIMVLDEPTTGQDYQEGIEIMEMVKQLHQEGHTIIFVTHDMELVAEYAKRVIVLSQGRILADGSCREIFYRPEILRQTNLFPPQIPQLAQKFERGRERFEQAIAIADFYKAVLKQTGRDGDARCG